MADGTNRVVTPEQEQDAPVAAKGHMVAARTLKLVPSGGVLFLAKPGLSREIFEEAVATYPLKSLGIVRPLIRGFLPFGDDEYATDYLLLAEDLIVLRLGLIKRNVPAPAISRLVKEKKSKPEFIGVKTSTLKSDSTQELLERAIPDERDSLIYYQPSSGLLFVADSRDAGAQEAITLFTGMIPELHVERWQAELSLINIMTRWLKEGPASLPDGLNFGQAARFLGPEKSVVTIKGQDPRQEHLLAHLDVEGVKVTELAFENDPGVSLVLTESGFFRSLDLPKEIEPASGLTPALQAHVFFEAASDLFSRLVNRIREEIPVEDA